MSVNVGGWRAGGHLVITVIAAVSARRKDGHTATTSRKSRAGQGGAGKAGTTEGEDGLPNMSVLGCESGYPATSGYQRQKYWKRKSNRITSSISQVVTAPSSFRRLNWATSPSPCPNMGTGNWPTTICSTCSCLRLEKFQSCKRRAGILLLLTRH